MPFVCRIKPITNEDIYPVAHDDTCFVTSEKGQSGWMPKYEQYAKQLIEYEQTKLGFTSSNTKEPAKPSLMKVMLFDLGNYKLLLAVLFSILSVGFQICQPSMMKEVLKAVAIKGAYSQLPPELGMVAKFPYVHAIILMIAPFLNAIFDTLSNRLIYHFSSNLRSGLAGLMYQKTLLLNITAQSNIDTGRLLSLLSSDTNQIAMMFPMFFYLVVLPLQIFIPFGFVCYNWGVSSLLAFGVMILSMPLQLVISIFLIKALRGYLAHNDERNKVTNETLQGMRVVKLSGLESIFLNRVEIVRAKQLKDVFLFTLSLQLMLSIMRATPIFVNASSMTVYIVTKDIPQLMFPVDVMSSVGMLTMFIQAAGMVMISQARVRDFLILPELKIIPNVAPDSEQIDVEIKNASFRWGDPPEIPLSANEKAELENEAKQRQKEAAKEEIRKLKELKENSKKGNFNYHNYPRFPNHYNFHNYHNYLNFPNWRQLIQLPQIQLSCLTKLKPPTLKNINLGSLTMVIGSVGSGKSSIGAALIGDIEKIEGEIRIRGQIAYCPQTAWINNNTVRGNITFGSEFNQKKYDEVVHVCALETDFKTLAAGDQTAIGEKGVNLSGGQKARIQLARSLMPIFLFDECINGRLKGKTILLMTNQLQFINRADKIVLMKDGCIQAQGTCDQLNQQGINFDEFIIKGNKKAMKKEQKKLERQMTRGTLHMTKEATLSKLATLKRDGTLSRINSQAKIGTLTRTGTLSRMRSSAQLIQQSTSVLNLATIEPPSSSLTASQLANEAAIELESDQKQNNQAATQIMTEEEQETGGVPLSSYMAYILSLVPWWGIVPFFGLTALAEGLSVFASWWMGIIGSAERIGSVSYYWKLGLYAIYGGACLIFFIIRTIISAYSVQRSNRLIHSKLLSHVMNAPSSFFDTTPLGRILNRFTGDISITDQTLFMLFTMVLNLWLGLIGQIIIICIDTVWFLFIGIPTLVVFYIVQSIYGRASRNLQRLEAISRSPVLSHFSETVTGAGLSTISISFRR
ncbi:MAG: putative Metal resistance protein YCF1 [Streblomastix strix]|uniref:Putative Metal resistance protein YCF1 n=1 Tax=Streblomastix strix TaxID=222440 RepID=A0A5J4W176_9EUKA|nr:MAG: putative Metal resistance protein YCF1 [Streblomastix strix]